MEIKNLKKFYNLSAPILICGETGTGKSRLAKLLYESANINKETFITMHLASIKDELFESELFGHKKGSFTGAIENKNGYLKEVGNGTLFLDEIGELSLESQKKLLFLLEEKKFVPVGTVMPLDFKGRIILATNRNLEEMVKKGEFREDLYFRLMVFQIRMLPIREDKDALAISIENFFNFYKNQYEKPVVYLSIELKLFLLNYEWRGNIRELKNCIESLIAMSDRREIGLNDLPTWVIKSARTNLSSEYYSDDYGTTMEIFEEKYLRFMLLKNEGKVNETARKIKISKVNLINKTKKYNINTLKMRAEAA